MLDVGARMENREGWIGVVCVFVVLKGFGQGIDMVRSPTGKVLGILDHRVSRAETKSRFKHALAFGKCPFASRPAILL